MSCSTASAPISCALKGCLLFDHALERMIIQAVHQTFYPIIEAPGQMEDGSEFLVLIIQGHPPTAIVRDFAACRAGNWTRNGI